MATVITVKPGQLGAVFHGHAKSAGRMLDGAAKIAAQRSRTLLAGRTPTDLGQFKNAWRVRRVDGVWTLINEAPHAGIMEAGARPHAVSEEGREALAQWVRRHIPVVDISRGKNKGTQRLATRRELNGVTEKSPGVFAPSPIAAAINRIVDAICRKLATKGYKGSFFVRDSMPELRAFVLEEITASMQRHVGKLGGSGGAP